MCDVCDTKEPLIETLSKAKDDPSLLTEEFLDRVILFMENDVDCWWNINYE